MDSFLISSATTPKPLPCSPALAALRGLGEEPNFYLSKSKLLLEQVLNYRALQKDKALVVIIDEAHDIRAPIRFKSPNGLILFALSHSCGATGVTPNLAYE